VVIAPDSSCRFEVADRHVDSTEDPMRESKETTDPKHDDIIAAFDRERNRAREWSRRHAEQLHQMRAHERPVYIERRRKPRP
jgi:hypothetical protein